MQQLPVDISVLLLTACLRLQAFSSTMRRVREAASAAATVEDALRAVLRETGCVEHAAREDAAKPLAVGTREGNLRWVVDAAAKWQAGGEGMAEEGVQQQHGGGVGSSLRRFLAHLELRDDAGYERLEDSVHYAEEAVKLMSFSTAKGLQLKAALLVRMLSCVSGDAPLGQRLVGVWAVRGVAWRAAQVGLDRGVLPWENAEMDGDSVLSAPVRLALPACAPPAARTRMPQYDAFVAHAAPLAGG